MSATDTISEPASAASVPLAWRIGVAVVFALLYGWFLFAAVSNLVALPALYELQGVPEYTPWTTLVAGVVVPPVAYLAALVLGRGRALSARVVVLAAGLAATAAVALSLYVLG